MGSIGSIDEAPDLVINFKGNKIPVHKSVLIEASEYFRAMLTKDFKEADQNEIDIKFDVNVEIFQAIINYIYTDEIEFSTNNVEDISKTARYFMLENLMKSSFDFKMKFFERILKTESFLDWDLSTVQEILQSDRVVVSNEKKMLLFATKWMKYDFVNRCKSAAEILQNVRFSRITKEQLFEAAENFAFRIQIGILSKSTAPRQYHKKGLYLITGGNCFQRYCPIDGTVTNFKGFNFHHSQSYFVNDEKIYIFPTDFREWLMTMKCISYVYDPLTDSYTEMSIAIDEVVQFVKRFSQSDWYNETVALRYCSLGGVIYAFVFHENDVKVFALMSNAWVSNGPNLPIQLQSQTKTSLTACGDSIYLAPYFNDNKVAKLFRYKPSTQEFTEISCPLSITAYPFSSYKAKLLFRAAFDDDDAGHIVTYDTITKDFQHYLFPYLTYDTRIAIYNDSIYFISQRVRYRREFPVKHFDMSIFDEVLGLVEPPLPVWKTLIHSRIDQVVVIQ